MESTLLTTLVSVQESWKRGELSQKKWLITFGPQNLSFEIRSIRKLITVKLPTHEPRTSWKQSLCFMMVAYCKGRQMAT